VTRLLSSIEHPRKITPENKPIQCRMLSVWPTSVPAMWRLGAIENADGASTNDRKMIPPTQTMRDSNIRKRRMDIKAGLRC